ncbi:acetyl-coA synthetase/AMP-(fatty) acid ligase [Marinobacter santoriniensis NKSG1]|uniref:Acetyl-coA synthetase/AMP-(Fatty) acid ligase n=2 Tax=Marinobacter TaxID=2742 RepID=M7CYK9_9GAMM|nr:MULTISPECIES: AMP-binding protein [Marinobacter]EMP57335.1 acetyl-coA synthetase/AMP-(fatty) acid ligase [Marinobacter santoriniensis NKSG1]MCK7549689.1 AMP-binding protein [Marinobacter koreensis]
MSLPQYTEVYNNFDAAALEADILDGRLDSGLNVCHEICDKWATDPNKVALYYEKTDGGDGTMTFAELKAASARFANYLASQGVGKGDRVAGLLPRGPELLVVIAGALRLGAVYQPLFTAFGSGAIEYRLERAGTKLVVTDPVNYPKLTEVKDCPPVLCVNASDTGAEVADFEATLASQSDEFEPVMIKGTDPFLQMFTSGTVGKAKGVAVPARALLAFYVYMKYAIDLREDDKFWNVADPGWAYGLYYAVVGPLLMGHATHFNPGAFTPESTYDMIRKYKITNLAAAPTAYRLLKANDQVLPEGENLGLRVASSAGEPLNPEVVNWIRNRHYCPVKDHYGQTETGMTCCNFHALEHPVRQGSMGYSSPGHRVVALNEKNEEVGEGEIGQLAVDVKASPLFHFDGYTWGEKDPFVKGYYLTGDMVISHGDGSYSFSGRDDDIITTAGYRVGPADVESTLLEHAAVAESGVVAKPDEKRGSIIKAFVVIKAGQEPADEQALKDELQELVRHRLSTHAFPREIEFVDELPKTPSGKIQRFVLRNRAKDEVNA